MSEQPVSDDAPAQVTGVLGDGFNVRTTDQRAVGTVRALVSSKDVMELMRSGKELTDTIVLTRGGAVTFAGPLLMKKPAGVITIEGSPESHMGILAREFAVSAVMSVELTDSSVARLNATEQVSDEYAAHVIETLNGRRVALDCSDPTKGRVLDAD